MIYHCETCQKEIERHLYCGNACRVAGHRQRIKTKSITKNDKLSASEFTQAVKTLRKHAVPSVNGKYTITNNSKRTAQMIEKHTDSICKHGSMKRLCKHGCK